jgi:hypothetical protein
MPRREIRDASAETGNLRRFKRICSGQRGDFQRRSLARAPLRNSTFRSNQRSNS